jgi:N-acetylmuramoyl-L-alanine amidase
VDFDASTQAQTANRFLAEVYVGFEVNDDAACTLSYYEVPTFVSVGGRNLAKRIAAALADRAPELSVRIQGVRHPILRETRMPAVLCSMGPGNIVVLKTSAVSAAVADAIDAWRADPTTEI